MAVSNDQSPSQTLLRWNTTKAVIREMLPPIILRLLKSLFLRPSSEEVIRFTGKYESWSECISESSSYDSPIILSAATNAAQNVRRGAAIFERDGVAFYSPEYRWPLLACLLRIAAENENQLRVLDYGGALGSTLAQSQQFLSNQVVSWNIVEQPRFVSVGRELFESDQLSFFESIDECLAAKAIDIVLLSAVIAYLENPYDFLTDLVGRGIEYILLDRTPVLQGTHDRLTLQHVPPSVYGEAISYPAWFFSRPLLQDILGRRYRLVCEFDGMGKGLDLGDTAAAFVGQLWQLRSQSDRQK